MKKNKKNKTKKRNKKKKKMRKKKKKEKNILMEQFGNSPVMEMIEVKMFQKKCAHVATEYVRI